MRWLVVLVALVGCKPLVDDDFKVNPGGSGPTGNGGGDPPDVDAGTGSNLTGRVCVLTDPRDLSSCALETGPLKVQLGSATATTAIDGTFAIATPTVSNLYWRVSGDDLVTSLVPFSAATLLPAMTLIRYVELTNSNGVTFDQAEGGVFVRVVSSSTLLAGVSATVDPPSITLIRYDGSSDLAWDEDATGSFGTIWIPDAPVSPGTTQATDITITPPLAAPFVATVPVQEQTLTFVTVGVN